MHHIHNLSRILLVSCAVFFVQGKVSAQAGTDGKYIEHTVKWYEDLSTVSAKYGVPEDVLISINKLQNKTLRARQILIIPTGNSWESISGKTDVREADNRGETENVIPAAEHRDMVRFTLLLPLMNEDGSCNENNMDFYCGVLMAARQAGKEGIDIVLNANDYNKSLGEGLDVENNDFILGPVKYDDIEHTLAGLEDSDITLLSPLDPKSSRLAESDARVVQASASSAGQYNEAAKWALEIGSEYPETRYIIIGGDSDPTSLDAGIKAFSEAGIEHRVCTTGVMGDIIDWEANSLRADSGHNIVLLAISNEAILNNAIRNMGILGAEGNLSVLTGSRIRSYETIPEEDIHKARLHAVCPYYVDYTDSLTLSFIHQYRSLFNNEPSQFSYQGYDVAYVAVKLFSEFGRAWMNKASEGLSYDMLQTSFRFVRKENAGYVNTGMRRIVYNPDFSITLEKGD